MTRNDRSALERPSRPFGFGRWSLVVAAFTIGLILAGHFVNWFLPVPPFQDRVAGQCYWTSAMLVTYECHGFLGASFVGFVRNLPLMMYYLVVFGLEYRPLSLVVLALPALLIISVAAVFHAFSKLTWWP